MATSYAAKNVASTLDGQKVFGALPCGCSRNLVTLKGAQTRRFPCDIFLFLQCGNRQKSVEGTWMCRRQL